GSPSAAFAAEQLIDGHVGELALDVPEGNIDAGDGVVQYRAIAPVAVDHVHLEDFFDALYIAPNDERFDVMLNRGDDGVPALREGRAAESVQARLRCNHFDDDQTLPGRLGQDDLNVFNRNWSHDESFPLFKNVIHSKQDRQRARSKHMG